MSYIAPEQKYEDLKSSASAFLCIGAGIFVFSLLCWMEIITLPHQGGSAILMKGMLTCMGVASFIGGVILSRLSVRQKTTALKETEQTHRIMAWFSSTYSAEDIDEAVRREFPDIGADELNLKRLEYIQDYLITGQDLPDEGYVDALTEELFVELFPEV